MTSAKYILYRSAFTILLLFAVLTFMFFFFRFLPGDYTDLMLFQGASAESVAAFEERWGLNDPLHVQYLRYLENLAQLDAGRSLQHRMPVWSYVSGKIFNSFILVAPAITTAYIFGSVIGAYIGNNRGSRIEKYTLITVLTLGSFPAFFTSIVLVILFASVLGWFPTSGMVSHETIIAYSGKAWWRQYLTSDFLMHYTLPFFAILIRYLYYPVMIMRTNVVEVKRQDFFLYHRMTGIPKFNRLRHLMKHASLPVITLYPVSTARAIGGLVLVEIVFNWPGIGLALINGVRARDVPVVQFVFFLIAAWVIIGNFVVDIVYGFIDPRVSVE